MSMSTTADSAGGQDHAELDAGLVAGVTDRGVRHQRNEDAIALATVYTAEGPVPLAIISDGVSSAPRPHEASLAAVRAAIGVLAESVAAGEEPGAASIAAVRTAASALIKLAGPGGAPAATYVSAVAAPDAVTVCWLGDSRAYWLAADPAQCTRVTRDDSLAEELVAAGLASPEEAMASPQAHVITRWLGADLPEPVPHVVSFTPPGPGALLVCSDGLWNYRPEAAGLAALLALPSALGDPLAAASSLVRFAVEAGGMDNITVALIPLPVRTATVPIPIRTATVPVPTPTVPVPTATPPAPLPPERLSKGVGHRLVSIAPPIWRGPRPCGAGGP
jgi:serine/threonine protein phosphatase PrpC